MIVFKTGDIFSEDVEALVNPVNCVGIMGRGVALQFRKAWPENYKAYAEACRKHDVQPGRMFVFENSRFMNPRYIINFPTKRHWRDPSRIEDIESGLAALVEEIQKRSIRSIAMPAIGAGLGGLSWIKVRSLIEKAMTKLNETNIIILEPH
jgi:O-acetyl-ADP-ribose deacetylase (regulator of RNase III)